MENQVTLTLSRLHLLQELFDQQREQIANFFDQLDLEEAEAMLTAIQNCRSMLFFSGVGKSGLIAEKLAVTLVSTGTRALFIPPTNALHGDLGIVSEGDLFIMISKSGETDELLNLIPFVRNKGATLAAWVSTRGSRLERACDLTVFLPVDRELCPFNLAPTTSTAVQLIFGDVLAIALMREKNFSLVQFARNHPAGRIGKRVTMRVCDLMLKGTALPLCGPEACLEECLVELSNKRCGCLLVVDDDQRLLGIFTDGDLRRALQTHGAVGIHRKMKELMVAPFRFIDPDTLAWDAMKAMEADQKWPIMVLPVLVAEKKVVGLIKMHDILQAGLA
jgi:arabinose-5-phosphate isomerase